MQLNDYIQGNRHGKEANRLEREAINDPFLQGALDGFDAVAGDHVEIIEQLEAKYARHSVALRSKKRALLYWSAAASVLLLIGFGFYFLTEKNNPDAPSIAKVQKIQPAGNEIVIPADHPSTLEFEHFEEAQSSQAEISIVAETDAKTPAAKLEADSFESVVADMAYPMSEQAEAAKVTVHERDKQTVHGKVVDETGEPLIGVSIVKKGTTNGTATDINGNFSLEISVDDSSKLMASYIGYESKEINPLNDNQIIALKESELALSEVVVVGYGTQKKSTVSGAVARVSRKAAEMSVEKEKSTQTGFGEKEFQAYCRQKANKNVCDGQGATVNVSFFINETGKPADIEYKKYSCEEAKKEIENLLSSSPVWTKTNRKVSVTVKW